MRKKKKKKKLRMRRIQERRLRKEKNQDNRMFLEAREESASLKVTTCAKLCGMVKCKN